MNKHPLVSIIIPTRNSSAELVRCIAYIRKQTYIHIEVIVVDSHSTDDTEKIAKKNRVRYYRYEPDIPKGLFDAPHKRNYGVKKAKGKYIYLLDADMELTPNVVSDAVKLCEISDFDAVIVHEDSYGEGIWAGAKNLERRCYWEMIL